MELLQTLMIGSAPINMKITGTVLDLMLLTGHLQYRGEQIAGLIVVISTYGGQVKIKTNTSTVDIQEHYE